MASERLDVILNLITGNYKSEARAAATATGRIGEEAKRTSTAINNIGPQMQTAGRAMAGFGVAVVAGFGLAAKAAIDWQTAFTGVRKTVDASEEEFAALEQGLIDISLRAPISAEELAKIAESAGQLGIAKENILDFTETVAALSVTTNLTSEEAATSLAQLVNIMGTAETEFSNLASAVVDLGNKGASTEQDILAFGLRIAGAGKIAGLTEAQVLGIGSAFASAGVEAEAGGSAIQKVLIAMTQAVATGNEDLRVFAATAGLTAEEFTAAWRADPGAAFTQFVEGLGRSGDAAFTVLEELGLQDQRLIRAFLSVANAGDLLRTNIDNGTDAYRENSAAAEEAATRYATVASELTIAFNAVKALAIEIGTLLLPAIRFAAGAAADFAEFLADLPDPLKVAAAALTGITGGFALMGGAALILIPRIATTVKAIKDLRLAILGLRAAQVGGTLASVGASATVAGTASVGSAAALTGPLAATLAAGLALEAHAEKMGSETGGYTKFLYEVGKAAQWLAEQVKGKAEPAIQDFTDASSDKRIRDLRPALEEGAEGAEQLAVQALAAATGIDETTAAALLGVDPLEELGEAAKDPRDRLNELAAAQRNATTAFLESANPVFAAVAAAGRFRDAVANLEELRAAKAPLDDINDAMLTMAETRIEKDAALLLLGQGNLAAGIALIGDALNMNEEATRIWLGSLVELDGTSVNLDFLLNFRTTGIRPDLIDRLPLPKPILTSPTNTEIEQRQHGGAAYAGRPYLVGEGGMEMFIPQRSGTMLSNTDTRRLLAAMKGSGGAGWDVTINTNTVDTGAIDLLGTLAGVQRRVESRR